VNLYDGLVEKLKEEGKTIKDVRYITSFTEYEDNDDEWSEDYVEERFNIPLNDFIRHAKDIDVYDTSSDILIVGDNWWIATDADEGYFEYIEVPKKATKTINLAKELLAQEDEIDPLVLLGIKFKEDE